MKTFAIPHTRLWLILAIQINFFFLSYTQDPAKGDQLVAPLPDLLKSEEDISITSSAEWEETRRGELLELFRENVYGRVPQYDLSISHRLVFEDREALQGKAIQKEVILELSKGGDKLEIPVLIFLPKNQKQAVPDFL